MVRNFSDTQDLVQQTCLTLWEKYYDFEAGTDFGAWACEVARMKVLNFLKTQRRRKVHFGDAFLSELADIESEMNESWDGRREALQVCVEKLPEEQRQLLWRCYSDRETIAQVSAALGRTADGVYGSLRNIRQKLMNCIERTLRQEANP
jgi:RNA polymerase sigma-70 factor (ECF subfamily)